MEDRVKVRTPTERKIKVECDVIDNGKDGERTMPARG